MKKYETKIEECFLNDIHFGDIKDIIGTTHSGKKEYMPIFHYWITHQKENILLAPTSDNIEK